MSVGVRLWSSGFWTGIDRMVDQAISHVETQFQLLWYDVSQPEMLERNALDLLPSFKQIADALRLMQTRGAKYSYSSLRLPEMGGPGGGGGLRLWNVRNSAQETLQGSCQLHLLLILPE